MSDINLTGSFEESVELSSLDNIKTDGISIRVGGQIIKFVADDVQDITVEQEVRNELKEGYNQEVETLRSQVENLKGALKSQVKQKNRELDRRERELDERLRTNIALPTITEEQMRMGLTVSRDRRNRGYYWSFICVYAPKYVSDKIIDPSFAKRLMTPIRIFIHCDDSWRVDNVKLVKLINCEKFQHFHSMNEDSDCWGDFKFSGTILDDCDKAIKFVRDIQATLETINRMSIGNRAPKGLSRLTTVEKHLLTERPDPENNKRTTNASRRNDRAGFDDSVNSGDSTDTWST